MFCSNCGKQVSEEARFCEICGNRIHSKSGSGIYNCNTQNKKSLKKSFDLEKFKYKKGLEIINTWLAEQSIKIDKSFFKTYFVEGLIHSKVKIIYAEFTYHTTNTNKRYFIDTVYAISPIFGTKSGHQKLEEAQRKSEEQHSFPTVERTYDKQIVLGGQPVQTRVILYSYTIDEK